MSSQHLKCLLLLFFLPLAFQSPGFAMHEFDKQDFTEYIKTEMKKWNVPGVAVLLIKDGKVIFSEGFGYRDVERKLAVDSKTVFPIASCTKTFASFTVGLLNVQSPLEHQYYDVFKSGVPFPSGDLSLRIAFDMNDMAEINVPTTPLQPGVEEIRFNKLSD